MQSERTMIPAQVRTELDQMNLLDRFLFNETYAALERNSKC